MMQLGIALGIAFALSAGIAFFSGRLRWAVAAPSACLIVYLAAVGGSRMEAFGFALGIFVIAAIPIGLVSWVGARVGLAAWARLKNADVTANDPAEH